GRQLPGPHGEPEHAPEGSELAVDAAGPEAIGEALRLEGFDLVRRDVEGAAETERPAEVLHIALSVLDGPPTVRPIVPEVHGGEVVEGDALGLGPDEVRRPGRPPAGLQELP